MPAQLSSPALPIVLPLLVGAALAAANRIHRRPIADLTALITAAVVAILCLVLLWRAQHDGLIVAWMGGWRPRAGLAIGIDLAIDPIGAGLASLAAVLVTASLVFSWRWFDAVGNLYHTLMLVFLGGMVGFCLSGDVFDMFVFFELMGVAAIALAGYEIEEPGPLQGALNLGVTNIVGGFVLLTGIGLLYGRTGALNLAQLGQALSGHPADGLTVVAFLLVACGFLVKAAVVPFHFWLADAHAVAPTPVCVLFSGVMVPLGLYGAARVYWTALQPALGDGGAVGDWLLAVGALTAVVGAAECVAQRHLKRMLAFSTVSHVGMFAMGVGLGGAAGLGGVALYVAGHGLIKGALFMLTGRLLQRFGSVDVGHLFGKGRPMVPEGVLYGLGGLALAGMPPFALGLGKALIDEQGTRTGAWWAPALLTACAALCGAAVLRAALRVFAGAGSRPEPRGDWEGRETRGTGSGIRIVLVGPAVVLLGLGLALGVAPTIGPAASAAARFQSPAGYAAAVLHGITHPAAAAAEVAHGPDPAGVVLLVLGTVMAAGLATAMTLVRPRARLLPSAVRRVAGALRGLQSGDVRDYVAWQVAGIAVYGVALALGLRAA